MEGAFAGKGTQGATAITLDIDWAPDFVIDMVADILIEANVPATWFVTHASPAVDRLRERNDLFELGIHPNFLPNSSHGTTVPEVLAYCMDLVPDAVSMRSHALVQSSVILSYVMMETPIQFEASLFLPHATHLVPIVHHIGHRRLVRLPYWWEDDAEMLCPVPEWDVATTLSSPGLKIFDFHPIHIVLNSASMTGYAELKQLGALQSVLQSHCDAHIFGGRGTGTAFRDLVDRLSATGAGTRIDAIGRGFLAAVTASRERVAL